LQRKTNQKTRKVTYEVLNHRNLTTKQIKQHVSPSSLAHFHLLTCSQNKLWRNKCLLDLFWRNKSWKWTYVVFEFFFEEKKKIL